MAKNVMLANDVYEKLKNMKEISPSMSYSDIIRDYIEGKRKTAANLKEALIKLKVRKDDERVKRILKEGWARWTKRYA